MYLMIDEKTLKVIGETTDEQPLEGILKTTDQPEDYPANPGELLYYVNGEFTQDESVALSEIKSRRIKEIKQEAYERIQALDWRKERAEERQITGAEGETLEDVLNLREEIRKASDEAEQDLNTLDVIEDIVAFSW